MALGGIASGFGNAGFFSIVAAATGVCVMLIVAFRGSILGGSTYVPVELRYGGHRVCLTALRDTGNRLTDPLTGQPVLIVAADVASRLTGLTCQQLSEPSEAILTANIPGLRLIPYHTVGKPNGMLLGMRMSDVKIGRWKGSSLVAFSPNGLSGQGEYQALTGGAA